MIEVADIRKAVSARCDDCLIDAVREELERCFMTGREAEGLLVTTAQYELLKEPHLIFGVPVWVDPVA